MSSDSLDPERATLESEAGDGSDAGTEGKIDSASSSDEERTADLAAQVELLTEENRRLRGEYVRARQTTYRRTALGLFAVGALAVLGALALPESRTVLFALGGTGIFAAVLSYYLTPERFVAAETGERVYSALAATGDDLAAELGLQDDRIYVPTGASDDPFAGVRLFVPQHGEFDLPDADSLSALFVAEDDEFERGVSLSPTGGGLYREFETSMADEIPDDPGSLGEGLADALAEGFELVESAATDADAADGRLTVEVSGSAYGDVDRFDHPVASLLAVGMAANLDAPVSLDTRAASDDSSADYLVTCEWNPDAAAFSTAE
ncbi:hypothetical protein [Halorussus ruber]|uniref:hypothetical protein n=1 Tax=Halorussus ruber TaxID=1126238 RepID=UPI001FEA69EF|nr:hypothetical protein [Halorussus ruber]